MINAASFPTGLDNVVTSILKGFANVAFTGTLLLSLLMAAGIVWYSKRRPKDAPLTWGEAMTAAIYVTAAMTLFFGIVPDRWLAYAEGELGMRSDAILAGPGSTGWLSGIPLTVTKATISDIVTILIYGLGMNVTIILWSIWQKRGSEPAATVEKSYYGRPLVKT